MHDHLIIAESTFPETTHFRRQRPTTRSMLFMGVSVTAVHPATAACKKSAARSVPARQLCVAGVASASSQALHCRCLGACWSTRGSVGCYSCWGKTYHRHSFSHPCYHGPAAAKAIGCVERAHRSRSRLFFDKLYGQPPSCGNLLMRARNAATRELFCSCGLCRGASGSEQRSAAPGPAVQNCAPHGHYHLSSNHAIPR